MLGRVNVLLSTNVSESFEMITRDLLVKALALSGA